MSASLEFLLGLPERQHPARVAWEDFQGPHGPLLRLCQEHGFLSRESAPNPSPACPCCFEGLPHLVGERCLCSRCFSQVDLEYRLVWRFDLEAFLRWLSAQLELRGGLRPIDARLWQLGTNNGPEGVFECFYWRSDPLSASGRQKLAAYRNAVVLYGVTRPDTEGINVSCVSLLSLVRLGEALSVPENVLLISQGGEVRFDERSGVVKVGDVWHGEVPLGSKEYYLLLCLSEQLDRFVAYADIKHFVLRRTGSKDTTEEATFCHRLKNRIKDKGWVAQIDRLLATTNKGTGYRLRGHVEGAREA